VSVHTLGLGSKAMEGEDKSGGESSVPPATSTSTMLPPRPSPPTLLPRITFRPLDARSLPDLKALNAALFPINYGPRMYEQALAAGGISHGAFFDEEELVGAITVRLEAGTASGSATAAPAASLFVAEKDGDGGGSGNNGEDLDGGLARMYVMTVGVLSPWRGKGIGESSLFFSFF
jgi:GNAT superfamily N-acetyltransferase